MSTQHSVTTWRALIQRFLDAPCWAVSDVRMLYFFTRISLTNIVVLAILTGL